MKRKISKIGSSTLMVSLPSKWCKANNVKKGDEVDIYVSDNLLRIVPKEQPLQSDRVTVDITRLSDMMVNVLLPVYHKAGYDEIEILFSNARQFHTVRDRIKSMLVGYEIIEQSSTRCVVRYLVGEGKTEIEPIIRRTFLVVQSFADETYKALMEGRTSDLADLLTLEETINRLTNLIERTIHKESLKNSKSIFLYLIVWLLESIGDDYRDLCKHFNSRKRPAFSKECMALLKRTNDLVKAYYQLYYQFSLDKCQEVYQAHEKLQYDVEQFSAKTNDETALLVFLAKLTARIENVRGSTIGLFI